MKYTYAFILLLIIVSCSSKKDNQEAVTETTGEWKTLFDGQSTEGWRGYNEAFLPDGWIIEDGTLKALGVGDDRGGDIIYAAEEFENFDLTLEWKISPGGNSGVLYHIAEGAQYQAFYENGPEYQLIDEMGYPEKLERWQSVGADYAMYNPAADKLMKPAGEWNQTRIRFTPEKVEYWLNSTKTVEFVPWTADWDKRKVAGKWKDYPDYGKYKLGYIGLQDHGGETWFRNIKILKL